MVNFKQQLEKATSGTQSDPDWEAILEIVEEVKAKNITAKNAMKEFRKRLQDNSGIVVYHTLLVLDSLMKNCTSDVHVEVLCVDFLGIIKGIVTSSKGEKAVDKALELIGEWKSAFGQETGYKAINTVFSELEKEGFHIPVTPVASAAFIKKAPEWLLSDRCSMCRQDFNRFKGKLRHHCRNCGKSVCAPCSTKRISLPHFGVAEATRVCDVCFKRVEKGEIDTPSNADSDLPAEYLQSSLAQESQTTSSSVSGGGGGGGSGAGVEEDDDLQLALAMSLNEQENKKPVKKSSSQVSISSVSSSATPSAPPPSSSASTLYASIVHDFTPEVETSYPSQPRQSEPSSNDPLARYLDRNYWEQRKEQQTSGNGGGPPSSSTPSSHTKDVGPQPVVVEPQQGAGATGNPLAEGVRKTIDMFMKRLHDVNSNGASIATDPVVLSLYQNLTAMQPQLLQQIDKVQQQKAKQVAIINKLNESKEARVTLNRMRREHQDKIKQMEQEQSMLARMQMEQKLALLRQQKQEQLEFQSTLKQKRLEVLHSQRAEFEQKVAMQREMERQQLIVQEQKVLHHQFGGRVGAGGNPQLAHKPHPPHPGPTQQYHNNIDPSSMTFHDPAQAMPSLHDHAQPLPSKLDYNLSMDPPPYNPGTIPLTLPESDNLYASYQTPAPHAAAGYYTQPPPPSLVQGQPPSMHGQPTSLVQGQPPSMHGQPPSLVQGQPPSMHGQPPSLVQGQPPSMHGQPTSLVQGQPPSMHMGPGQPLSLVQHNMGPGQPLNMGPPPPPPSMGPGQPSNMVPGQPPSMEQSNMGPGQPSSMSVGYSPNVAHYGSAQQGFSQAPPPSNGSHGNYTAPQLVGNPLPQQQYQQESLPPPSTHPQPPPQSYVGGYPGFQTQYPQTMGGVTPNGAQFAPPNGAQYGVARRESESPLISFD